MIKNHFVDYIYMLKNMVLFCYMHGTVVCASGIDPSFLESGKDMILA